MKNKTGIWFCPLLVMGLVLILTHSCQKDENAPEAITDKDGNVYTSVTIGTQVWMVENLKTTKFNDGTAIPLVTDNTAWKNLVTPGYCWYNNDAATYKEAYGALYNWYAVNTGKLCPSGWHVPTVAEWETLTDYLGTYVVAGGKLKETGNTHWNAPNAGASNESGFTALPGGDRSSNGAYDGIGGYGTWWSSTEDSNTEAKFEQILSGFGGVYRDDYAKQNGFSVRCLQD